MKVCRLRVIVPADDAALLGDVAGWLQRTLEQFGTKRLLVEKEAEDLAGAVPGPRVHWAAVDVLQGDDRPLAAKPKTAKRKAAA